MPYHETQRLLAGRVYTSNLMRAQSRAWQLMVMRMKRKRT
jgi:hypothetical protein